MDIKTVENIEREDPSEETSALPNRSREKQNREIIDTRRDNRNDTNPPPKNAESWKEKNRKELWL